MKKKILTIAAIALLVGAASWWFRSHDRSMSQMSAASFSTPTSVNHENTGSFSSSTATTNVYTNDIYGFKFTYPSSFWRVGSNSLGYGTLQLFNYPENQASGKDGFSSGASGMNKIEAVVVDSLDSYYGPVDDYPEESRETQQVSIAGTIATRGDIKFAGDQEIRFYAVPLPDFPGKFFAITMYGDRANFHTLDDIVRSIEWIR